MAGGNQVFKENEDAVEAAGCAQAVAGEEESQKEDETEENAGKIRIHIVAGHAADAGAHCRWLDIGFGWGISGHSWVAASWVWGCVATSSQPIIIDLTFASGVCPVVVR